MPQPTELSVDQLARLIGRPDTPALVDVCLDEDFASDPALIPGSVRRRHDQVDEWGPALAGSRAVVICQKGRKLSHGAAAWLRIAGIEATVLEGGVMAWAAAGLPRVPAAVLPPRDAQGRTVWVTRARPKVDRIACPWLIRRFVDPAAAFLFVPTSEVMGVADRFGATPFDLEGEAITWTHRGPLCTFDVMVQAFGLGGLAPLAHLARIVRAADTATLDAEPEAAGLLAVSLGLSRMHADDLVQLEHGFGLYDALYRWCRDATGETHNWPSRRSLA